jgi:hypothetical protein
MINKFVIVPNPDFVPAWNTTLAGNFDLLDLSFVRVLTYPVAFFTRDGLPINKTKHSSMMFLGYAPTRNTKESKIDDALWSIQKMMSMEGVEMEYIVESVEETDFNTLNGFKIKGSVKGQHHLLITLYY